jgi:hypothetical protein
MKPESKLNAPTAAQNAEQHALSCWAALERHVQTPQSPNGFLGARCGCYKHSIAGHIVVHKSCALGDALAEEYEIASRRVREASSHKVIQALESGDMGSTLEVDRIEEYRADPAFRVRT